MGILAWIVVGLVAGVTTKALVPGRDPSGIIITVLLGIAGAIVGGFLSIALGVGNGVDDFDVGTIFLAIVGAIILLVGYHAISGGTRARV